MSWAAPQPGYSAALSSVLETKASEEVQVCFYEFILQVEYAQVY